MIKHFLIKNWYKVAGLCAILLSYISYIFRGYLLDREREKSDNLQAKLDRETQSNQAQAIINSAESSADATLLQATREATNTSTDGDEIASKLSSVFDDN